jgi:alkaline phosphatase
MMPRSLNRWFIAGSALLVSAVPLEAQQSSPTEPTRIILFIGDGVGTAQWTAALVEADALAVQEFPVVGLVDTRASNAKVTDSAAGATAFAAGVRTFNGAIGVGPDSVPVVSVLEVSRERGLATGLVATSTITHATPASFAAHVPSRAMEVEIARQMAEQPITVLLGGGRAYFDPARRPDSLDLLAVFSRRGAYVETVEQLAALQLDTTRALVGLFAEGQPAGAVTRTIVRPSTDSVLPPDTVVIPPRTPSLPQMTSAALAVLDRDAEGFFLMVEGSQPDWRGHENAPLELVIAEVLDFDAAIRVGLEYQARHPETLIVVVADHETGGLALHYDQSGAFGAHYTTQGHTAAMIPLFAAGPGAEAFGGVRRNDEIGQLLLAWVRRR